MTGDLHAIEPGDPRGRWSHDGEGNAAIWAMDGNPRIVAAGLDIVRDQLFGAEPTLLVEDDHGRRAVFLLHPFRPSDELINEIPMAFARLPPGYGSWELIAERGGWREEASTR